MTDSICNECADCGKLLPEPYVRRVLWAKNAIHPMSTETVSGNSLCPLCIEAQEVRAIGEVFDSIACALSHWHFDLGYKFSDRPDIAGAYRQGIAALLRLRDIVTKDMTATILAKADHERMILADGQEELEAKDGD